MRDGVERMRWWDDNGRSRRHIIGSMLVAAGLVSGALSGPAPVLAPVAVEAPGDLPEPVPLVGRAASSIPCTGTASACVDLTTQRAWLLDHGTVLRGPVPVRSGGPGHATPQGTFRVSWKDRDHISAELGGIPMPDAVFFAAGGIALHEGPLTRSSAGCVHLRPADAAAMYSALTVGAQVQVLAPHGDAASSAAGVGRPPASRPPPTPTAGTRGAPQPKPRQRVQRGIPGVTTIGPPPRT